MQLLPGLCCGAYTLTRCPWVLFRCHPAQYDNVANKLHPLLTGKQTSPSSYWQCSVRHTASACAHCACVCCTWRVNSSEKDVLKRSRPLTVPALAAPRLCQLLSCCSPIASAQPSYIGDSSPCSTLSNILCRVRGSVKYEHHASLA